ncbi:Uncharacterized conserved protein [Phaffia rhodozyma]|uniref:Uncharacterized conserved protein n=1 Tax=Phaffia rhodozyma TaxID=264483 RepID=A0A0F7SL76_PHARH|nr:Uncharacterized conserved protein [Phaffia rhodozyma]
MLRPVTDARNTQGTDGLGGCACAYTMADLFDSLDSLNHVEETFYQTGYREGFEHGALHGLFEGRALGKEKGFELWEEVGFYEGVGTFWRDLLGKETKSASRAINHINQLLHLISLFPTHNISDPENQASIPPTQSLTPDESNSAPSTTPALLSTEPTSSTAASPEVDISALLERIRAKYKLVCSSLGIRPRLVEATMPSVNNVDDAGFDGASGIDTPRESQTGTEESGSRAGSRKGTVVVNGIEVSSKALLF